MIRENRYPRQDRIPEYLTEVSMEQAKAMWSVGADVYYAYFADDYKRTPWTRIEQWPLYLPHEELKFFVEKSDA